MATTLFAARGAQTMNSVFSKPTMRKCCHGKSSSAEKIRDTLKIDTEEMEKKRSNGGDFDGGFWVPHGRTGIYYPKGQEKVMEDVPMAAARDYGVRSFENNQHS